MEMLGRATAYDAEGKPHRFEVYRSPMGYQIHHDGQELRRTGTHMDAVQVIATEAEKLGYRRRGC